jgi:putative hemolysin
LRAGADFETLAGFVLDRLGKLPVVGDRVGHDGITIEVVDMDERRIDKLLVTVATSQSAAPQPAIRRPPTR